MFVVEMNDSGDDDDQNFDGQVDLLDDDDYDDNIKNGGIYDKSGIFAHLG